ncbi:hypothetical protein CY34DRAFT_108666 [Suillus luteus UH-Slu-Lm8-n1]|uniref:Unplaced genomic scaffold CY34scaffold_261, whole genome shotgun sequence n=1 Tax=Suillus luteus UH-Slu-Lm8-n1 TaxID=930992 RepID=A0A0C9ZLS1_9AGAM|nr:hypothetical protein CY34DRAFT_108666 [Suillus luteus UH-Slu-Lm8-n1]
MSFHSASSQDENSDHVQPHDSEPTTHLQSPSERLQPNGSNLRSRSGHPAPLEDTISIRSISSQCENARDREALLERAISFLERTASLRSFSHFENEGEQPAKETKGLAPCFGQVQTVIVTTMRKTVFAALLLIVTFSVQDSRLLQLTDHLVFAVESGVQILIKEREVLRCMGTGGTMFYALVFLILVMIPL